MFSLVRLFSDEGVSNSFRFMYSSKAWLVMQKPAGLFGYLLYFAVFKPFLNKHERSDFLHFVF
jgi:hypothetical protein